MDEKTRGFFEARACPIQCRNVNCSSVFFFTAHLLLFRGRDSNALTKGCGPLFQQWMFTLEMTVAFYLNPCPLPPVRRFYSFPSVFTQKFAFSSINFFRFLSSGTYWNVSVKLVLRRENWVKTLETQKEIAMKNFFLGSFSNKTPHYDFFLLLMNGSNALL